MVAIVRKKICRELRLKVKRYKTRNRGKQIHYGGLNKKAPHRPQEVTLIVGVALWEEECH